MQIADGTFQITAGGRSENASSESSDSWGEGAAERRTAGGHGGAGEAA